MACPSCFPFPLLILANICIAKPFQRATAVVVVSQSKTGSHPAISTGHTPSNASAPEVESTPAMRICPACTFIHSPESCSLKISGVEHCNLCGLAHDGIARTCPQLNSETQVSVMLEALKNSPERKDLVIAAMKYLRGWKVIQSKDWTQASSKGLDAL